jgi:hypothetical protein
MNRILTLTLLLFPLAALGADDAKPAQKPKPVGGKSELLRFIPKVFATLQKVDVANHAVTILVEGEKEPSTWTINPDAELKRSCWWGRLDQFPIGDRVWVWFDLDRQHKKKSILMLADEISQQDISGFPPTLESADQPNQTIKVKSLKGDVATLSMAPELGFSTNDGRVSFVPRDRAVPSFEKMPDFKVGGKLFLQSAGGKARLATDADGLEKLRKEQRLKMRKRWEKDGLPGTVTFLHPLSGELEIMLDHEAIRWGRNLKEGDKVTIREGGRIAADVQSAKPWRERTLVRLVLDGFDQAEYQLGQRVHVLVPVLPLEADLAELPPDIDRPRTKAERIDWFLASTYCTCQVANNTCTGMFYTLASCNVNACGMPNHIRDTVAEYIDQGKTDRQIWDELKKSQGPLMLKPHLLP